MPPRIDDPRLDRAVKLVRKGMSARDAAEQVGGVAWRTVARRAAEAGGGCGAGKAAPVTAAQSDTEDAATGQVEGRAPLAEADRPPPVPSDLRGVDRDVWILEREVDAVRTSLAEARRDKSTRTAALTTELRRLLEEVRSLRPPPAPDAQEEERRWKAAGDRAIALIERGVAEAGA